jgi:hypothetical protein
VLAGRLTEADAALDRALAAARSSGDVMLLQETLHGATVAAFNAMRLDRCEALRARCSPLRAAPATAKARPTR